MFIAKTQWENLIKYKYEDWMILFVSPIVMKDGGSMFKDLNLVLLHITKFTRRSSVFHTSMRNQK